MCAFLAKVMMRSQKYLVSFGIYVDIKLFVIVSSVFFASRAITSHAPLSYHIVHCLGFGLGCSFYLARKGFGGFSLTFAGNKLGYQISCNLV